MKKTITILSALIVMTLIQKAHAFSEMVRHNYPNCIACHESPSGGGLLTNYGRTISHSVLSTWGGEKEARPFYGALDNQYTKNWLNVGGDLRGLQLHTNSKKAMTGRFIRMQTGIEAAAKFFNFKIVSFFGKQETGNMVRGESIRHYLMYQPTDEITMRIGRFVPNFGLNIPEHTLATRRGLGFDQGTERDQYEAMWNGEKLNASFSVSQSVTNEFKKTKEKAFATQWNYTIFDSYRIGTNVWFGRDNKKSRQIYGVNAVLGFTDKFYYLSEFDYQANFDKKKGLFHFSKVGYEIVKGFHLLGLEEYRKSDLNDSQTLLNAHGIGAQWFPRPHFDFEAIWNKRRVAQQSHDYTDYAYLMVHYYF
ncbi:MAG: hypothetical protein K2Q18_11350 [Bdellovibrionales bacterium]|nr:hypothetical protein [Bdellovibrionales bacterium]